MNLFSNIKGDLYGGITAAVVALPLALAFGVASGAGPLSGLWGAILIGFFASLFGGTPSQVSGPTGPMTVVMAAIVMQYAHHPVLAFSVVVMGGILQILFGFFRLGNLISLVPYTVVSGFMSGIGCIIIILQLAPLLGQNIPDGGTVAALAALPDMLSQANAHAILAGLLSLVLMIFWPTRLKRILPPPLVALLIGTLAVAFFLDQSPVLGPIPTGFPDLYMPEISFDHLKDMAASALILALLGSIDSLLTSLIADTLTKTPHNPNKELLGQGVGNIIAGLCGAIPGAGATMRTVINIRAGGTTPLSGLIHSVILFAIVMGFGPLAENIPHAVLAGILLKVGWDIIDWQYLQFVRTAPRKGMAHMLLVLFLTVFVDLIFAVGTGLVLASLTFVKHMAHMQVKGVRCLPADEENIWPIHLTEEETEAIKRLSPKLILYHFDGPLSFGAARNIFTKLNPDKEAEIVLFDFSNADYIDTTAALAFKEAVNRIRTGGHTIAVCGVPPKIQGAFDGLHVLRTLEEPHIFQSRQAALIDLEEQLAD